jgi:hypothetical protein
MAIDPVYFLVAFQIYRHDCDAAVPHHLGEYHGRDGWFGFWRAQGRFHMDWLYQSFPRRTLPSRHHDGLGQSVMFGMTITAVGCLEGLMTGGGAEQVGRLTTRAVVVLFSL